MTRLAGETSTAPAGVTNRFKEATLILLDQHQAGGVVLGERGCKSKVKSNQSHNPVKSGRRVVIGPQVKSSRLDWT